MLEKIWMFFSLIFKIPSTAVKLIARVVPTLTLACGENERPKVHTASFKPSYFQHLFLKKFLFFGSFRRPIYAILFYFCSNSCK